MRTILDRAMIVGCLLGLFGCSGASDEISVSGLRLIGERRLPPKMMQLGTLLGGLSGLDYDEGADEYYAICDDRSDFQPARAYVLKIAFSPTEISRMDVVRTFPLKQPDGSLYPNKNAGDKKVPDPEALRLKKSSGTLIFTSEGDRTLVIDPFVRELNTDGSPVPSGEWILPERYRMSAMEKGPRQNGVFEGLTLLPGEREAIVVMEEPLYEDGPRASPTLPGVVRFLRFDLETRKRTAEYAYPLDPIPQAPMPADGFAVNGVSEVLALGASRLLVLERAFSTGVGNHVRLYEVDLAVAEDVSEQPALAQGTYVPLKKRLLLNFASLGRELDNLEGLALGPRLQNGNPTLLVLSDDNFSDTQFTQLLAFEILPAN